MLALGPVAIHLLNRRRYRVLQWAAMDFLREAIQRNRRILQLRDLLLLLLYCRRPLLDLRRELLLLVMLPLRIVLLPLLL